MASSPDPGPAVSWSVIGHIVDRVACTVHTHGHHLPRPELSPATVGEQMQEVLVAALNGRAALDAGTTHGVMCESCSARNLAHALAWVALPFHCCTWRLRVRSGPRHMLRRPQVPRERT